MVMSLVKSLSRANREMQLENWTQVIIDLKAMINIHDDNIDEMISPADDLKATAVDVFLNDWCRKNIKGGFAIKKTPFAMNSMFEKLTQPCFEVYFKLPSEAVRFKLSWGGL